MLSIDTNILLHAINEDSPRHEAASKWMATIASDANVAISEFVLAEFYGLLRNPAVLEHPLSASEAVDVIEAYRTHPRWRLIGFSTESRPLHDALWQKARSRSFAFRRIYDARCALTMISHGVTELATANVRDFQDFGFCRVWNPLAGR